MDWDTTAEVLEGLAASVRARRAAGRDEDRRPRSRADRRLGRAGGPEHLEGAEVVGFGRARSGSRAAELGAIDTPPGSLEEALDGADACFCCAPVGALPEQVRPPSPRPRRTAWSPTSGSTKQRAGRARSTTSASWAATRSPARRRPGVEHARADLFEGAVWYLTPAERSAGILYERLHRAGGGPRRAPGGDRRRDPRPAAGRRQPPAARARQRARRAGRRRWRRALPRVGPSFRDATRVAGANSAIWTDIYLRQPRGDRRRDRRDRRALLRRGGRRC